MQKDYSKYSRNDSAYFSQHTKPIIGLLGGIGAGKSTVAKEFEKLGCGRIDADAIGHELLKDPKVKEELKNRWGEKIFTPNGEVDRAALADIVFRSAEDIAALNKIMHPRIRQRMEQQIEAFLAKPNIPAIVIDAALLTETDWQELCNILIFVSAKDDLRYNRVKQSRGWDYDTWKARENLQNPLDIKASKAEYIIDNNLNESSLREQVRTIFRRIIHKAGHT
ncbi:MAG: dephospho-CoA kinase [Planctomycetes bacterium]|nr:dephospho-CoA kinase [Planctomycetota bacterium]